ncbi:MAG: hypothetical protein WA634_12600 [Silvibacterium sp.]
MLITKSQVAYLGNLLHEVLTGFSVSDFDTRLGAPQKIVELLCNKLDDLYIDGIDGVPQEIVLSAVEALILRNAFSLCMEKLSPGEFTVRLGKSPEATQRFLQQFEPLMEIPVSRH